MFPLLYIIFVVDFFCFVHSFLCHFLAILRKISSLFSHIFSHLAKCFGGAIVIWHVLQFIGSLLLSSSHSAVFFFELCVCVYVCLLSISPIYIWFFFSLHLFACFVALCWLCYLYFWKKWNNSLTSTSFPLLEL